MNRRLLAALVAATAPIALIASGPAQAAEPRTTPAVAPAAVAAIPEPSTSPAPASRTWVDGIGLEDCTKGYFCAFVQSNVPAKRHTGWWRFKFYKCADYSLSYWKDYDGGDWSEVLDYQTGNVLTTLLGSSGNTIKTFRPYTDRIQELGGAGWNPVYKIRSCPHS